VPQPAHDWFAESTMLLPRFLGLLDREPSSGTYGCVDRNYWHYSLLDLPNARYQELAWLLALACQATPSQLAASPSLQGLSGHPKLLAWVQATVNFWLQHRHPDGSVDEVYPYERSFCATAFSTATLAETRHLLGPKLALSPHTLVNTGRWLASHQNPTVSNQQAASLLALYHLAQLTDDAQIKAGLAKRRQALLADQHPDGTWVEYGGLDVGYLTITLAMLAVYVQHSHDADLHQALCDSLPAGGQ
jgi:hypothetical protein